MRWLGALLTAVLCGTGTVSAQTPLLADLQAERARYGATMTSREVAGMLNAVAWKHRAEGWGLLRKGEGNSCPLNGTFISCDILIHAPTIQHFDVLIDAEGRAEPTWNLVGPCVLGPASGCEMSRYLAPIDPGGPAPTPTTGGGATTPVQTPVDLTQVYGRLDGLAAQVERIYADLAARDAERKQQIAAVDARVQQHDEHPSFWTQVFGNRYVQVIMGAAGAYITALQMH